MLAGMLCSTIRRGRELYQGEVVSAGKPRKTKDCQAIKAYATRLLLWDNHQVNLVAPEIIPILFKGVIGGELTASKSHFCLESLYGIISCR